MRKKTVRISVILMLSASSLTLRGGSVTLLSNLNQPAFPSPPVLGLDQFLAAPFITGGSLATFDSATIQLAVSQIASGHLHFGLYSDANGIPGSELSGGALTGPTSPLTGAAYTYSATAPIALSLNTRYWLVGSTDIASPNFNYGWMDTLSYDYSSSVDWQLPGYFDFSSDQGATWVSSVRPLMFQITGSIVPEPTALALLGFGLLAIGVASRRP